MNPNLPLNHCRICNLDKEPEFFNFRNKAANKLKKICKSCESKENSGRYAGNKDKVKENTKQWQDKNRDKYLKYQSEYNQKRGADEKGE